MGKKIKSVEDILLESSEERKVKMAPTALPKRQKIDTLDALDSST